MTLTKILLATVLAVTGTACSTYAAKSDMAKSQSTIEATATGQLIAIRSSVLATSVREDDTSVPYIAGRSVPLAKDVLIPAALRRNVKTTMLSPACVSASTLNVIANCLTEATGIATRVKADALMPAGLFAPRTGTAQQSQAGSTGILVPKAVDVPLAQLLDMIAGAYSVSYRLMPDGVLEFFRLETKTYRLKSLSQKMSFSMSQSTGFDNASKTSFTTTESDAIVSIQKTLLSMSTQAGTVLLTPETSAVTITDTPEVHVAVAAHIEKENKRLTRRVTLVFDQLYVSSQDNREFSLDWNIIYGALGTASTDRKYTGPGSVATPNAGAFSFGKKDGNFGGANVVIKALADQGLTVQHRSFPLVTQNGMPVSMGLPTIFDFVQEISFTQPGSGSNANLQALPTIKQREEKIGTYLTITPEAQDDGQILVSSNFQDRSGTLSPYVVQAGGLNSTLQQRKIDEIGSMVRTVLRAGVPTVISGLSEFVGTSKERRLDANASVLLGGSDAVTSSKRSMILIVTAMVEDGI